MIQNGFRRMLRLPVWSRRRAEVELDEEIRLHLELRAERLVSRGMAPEEAWAEARRRFGPEGEAREALRAAARRRETRVRGRERLSALVGDARHGGRLLRRNPGFALVAVLTLALGIGASSALFSVVRGVLLRSLPYEEAERLVRLSVRDESGGDRGSLSGPDFLTLRDHRAVFEELAVYDPEDPTLTGLGDARELPGAQVSAGFFEVFRARPILGRGIEEEDTREGSEPVVVLGHALWRQLFAGDPGVIGRTIRLDRETFRVVGVMPPGFAFPGEAGLWVPFRFDDALRLDRRSRWLTAVGRLRPGLDLEAANRELARVSERIAAEHPESNRDVGYAVVSLRDEIVGEVRTPLLLLMSAVGLVLLIACANVAGLLLARASTRREEMAIRAALGAGRGRLVRQLLAESASLAGIGGAAGLLLALLATRALVAARPAGIPRLDEVRVDGGVLLFAAGATLLCTLLVGLLPALRTARGAVQGSLREGGRGGLLSRGATRLRGGLVVAEVALAVVLLVGAGLLLRSFAQLTAVDPGFRPERVLTFPVELPRATYDDEAVRDFYRRVVARAEAIPGVASAGAVFRLPLASSAFNTRLSVDGTTPPPAGQEPTIEYRSATPGYFRTMGIPILRGRGLEARDRAGAVRAVVVNESAARRFFPGQDPIGRQLRFGAGMIGDQPYTVIGVVGDVRQDALDVQPEPGAFFSLEQVPTGRMAVVVRAVGDPAELAGSLRAALRELDPDLPAAEIRTLESVVGESVARPRFLATLLALFAGVALLLSALGVFGLLSYSVAQRTREIGLRIALGARPGSVEGSVVRGAAALTASGLLVGIVGALALSRLLRGVLFGVAPTDPATFAAVVLVLGATTVVASAIPARRAARVDPMVALRGE